MKRILFISLSMFCAFFSYSQDPFFTYKWRQVEGPLESHIVNPDSANTEVTGLYVPGVYFFEFSVTNVFGTGRDTCTVTVLPGRVLSVDTSQPVRIQRPEVSKFDIQMIARASDVLVQIKSTRVQTIKVYLTDMYGRRIAQTNIRVITGINIASLPKPHIRGIYFFQFITYYENETKKIIIL